MQSAAKHWTTTEIETGLRQIRGLTSVRLVSDRSGVIQEVHATVEGDRSPKQAARDIESVLLAKYALAVDHKKISIAQIDDCSGYGGPRLRWVDVAIGIDGSRAEAIVRLQKEGTLYTGLKTGQRSLANQIRLVAEATLRSVESAFGLDERFAIEEVNSSVTVAGRQAVVVVVNMLTDEGEDALIGSALARQDPYKAVALATLDAVNRRVLAFPSELTPMLALTGTEAEGAPS